MVNLQSSKKQVRIGYRNFLINRSYKSSIKRLLKKYRILARKFVLNKDSLIYENLRDLVSKLYSRIDKAVKKKVFHANKGARQKSRITKVFKTLSL